MEFRFKSECSLMKKGKETIEVPKIKGIKWIPIATEEYGWNIKHNRPALRSETYYNSNDVCLCEFCANNPHYGSHYCKRFGGTDERFYSDHHSRW
jgi:hypothetical protein